MAAHLESGHIPTCVVMGRAFHITELYIIKRFHHMDIGIKGYLQQSVAFLPIHSCHKINSSGIPVDLHILADLRISIAIRKSEHRSECSVLYHFHRFYQSCSFLFLQIEQINVPGIVVQRLILKYFQYISILSFFQHLSFLFLVKETANPPILRPYNHIKGRLQSSPAQVDHKRFLLFLHRG